MPANTSPIYTKVARINFATLVAANIAKDGTGAVATVFTADATNGSFLQKIRVVAKGTNVATVMRFFINNGDVNTVANNNSLFTEITLAASALSEVAAQNSFEVPMNLPIPPGYRVIATLGTAVAGGYAVTSVGGDY